MSLRAVGIAITLTVGIFAAPLFSHGQPPTKVSRIGYLSPASKGSANVNHTVIRRTLREMGYIEGQNIVFEERFADGELDRLHALAVDLARLRVDVLVAVAPPAIRAAKDATTTIPIVMAFSSDDPVRTGFVASLARPGGNITGLTILAPDLAAKRLELLREVVPKARRVAVLWNPANESNPDQLRQIEIAARSLGVQLYPVKAHGPDQYDSAFSAAARERAGALLVLEDAGFFRDRGRLVELAAKHRLPAISGFRQFAEAGGLMSYGPNLSELARRAAIFVDKILKGAKPADIPVEQPMRFELIINLKTAKALGLTFPQSILIRGDQVIQ